MKIALITFSRAKNYGGILQAYALHQYLSRLGHEVFFIDYIMERTDIYHPEVFTKNAASRSRLWGRNCCTRFLWKQLCFWGVKADFLKFSRFIEKECRFSDRYFSLAELQQDPPRADLYMVGSDQVWNSDYAPGKQLELPFYLPFVSGRKISYASSFGNNRIPEDQKKSVGELLRSFEALSVREESGRQILEELGLSAAVVADPTLLFDGSFWAEKCTELRVDCPYILLYQVKFDTNIYRVAQALAKRLGCRLVILSMNRGDRRKYGQPVVMTPSVEEWLTYIKNARLVYTDSFHAVAFSLQFHTPFVVNSASRRNMSSRITNLLELTGLTEREMTDYDAQAGQRKAEAKVDWERVDEKVQEFRGFSQQWLRESIARQKKEGQINA